MFGCFKTILAQNNYSQILSVCIRGIHEQIKFMFYERNAPMFHLFAFIFPIDVGGGQGLENVLTLQRSFDKRPSSQILNGKLMTHIKLK